MSAETPRKTARAGPGRFRIIAGKWRGRRLAFEQAPGVRPTLDRVRETLFNWLRPVIAGARCLDLFAGSGALGLEALSEGAAGATFVERTPVVASKLRAQLALLKTEAPVHCRDAFDFLRVSTDTFDIVFLDPPFGEGLLRPAFRELCRRDVLRPGARVYLEGARGELEEALAPGWELVRQGTAGEVEFGLAMAERKNNKEGED